MKHLGTEVRVLWETQRRRMVSLAVLLLAFALMFAKNVIAPGVRNALADGTAQDASGSEEAGDDQRTPEAAARPTIRLPVPPALDRDLFAYDRRHFPKPTVVDPDAQIVPKSGGVPVEGNEGPAELTQAEREAEVRRASEALRLRSLVVGATPLAVLEVVEGAERGRHLLAPGEGVHGFRLVTVRDDSVVLVRDDVEVELFRAPSD